MSRPVHTLSLLVILAGIGLLNVRCTNDEIPSILSPPFLRTDLAFTKSTTPTPGTMLARGRSYTVRFQVAYTLNGTLDKSRDSLTIVSAMFFDTGAQDTLLALSQNFPNPLHTSSGVITDSLTFTTPGTTGAVYLYPYLFFLDATLVPTNTYTTNSQTWSIQ
jgi:hypothetical protein